MSSTASSVLADTLAASDLNDVSVRIPAPIVLPGTINKTFMVNGHTSNRAPDKRGYDDKSKIVFLFLEENINAVTPLELSQQDDSNDGSQHTL